MLAAVLFGDLAAEDDGELVRPADRPVGVEQAFAQFVERGAATKDQIVAEFDLGEEQAVLAARLFALSCSEKRGEAGQPFLAAGRGVKDSRLQSQNCDARRTRAV
jgi:hypothetical protein